MIDEMLSGDRAIAVAIATAADEEAQLYDCEQAAIAGATDRRRREFTAGRACAHRALHQLMGSACPVAVGEARQPLWPAAVTGSITHTDGFCAAAVARSVDCKALGIDAERRQPVDEDAVAMFSAPCELADAAQEDPVLALVRFSAKESFSKAFSTLGGEPLDLRAIVILLDVPRGRFEVVLTNTRLKLPPMLGRLRITAAHVFTAVVF